MTHQIILSYSAVATNATPAALSAAMAAVPLYTSATQDEVLARLFGLTVQSDNMIVFGPLVTRTITLAMDFTAGPPSAPPFFPVHTQLVDGLASIFSTSVEDATLVSVPGVTDCEPECDTPVTTRPGIGARTVSVSYVDAEGHAGTVSVTLNGKVPVPIVLAPGTLGVVRVTAFSITSAGSLGGNVGQITVSAFDVPDCDPCPAPDPEHNQSNQDFLQTQLVDAIAYLPNSYYSYAMQMNPTLGLLPPVGDCEPCDAPRVPAPPLPTPGLLIAMLTNFFTATLSLKLATPVAAATPVLV